MNRQQRCENGRKLLEIACLKRLEKKLSESSDLNLVRLIPRTHSQVTLLTSIAKRSKRDSARNIIVNSAKLTKTALKKPSFFLSSAYQKLFSMKRIEKHLSLSRQESLWIISFYPESPSQANLTKSKQALCLVLRDKITTTAKIC